MAERKQEDQERQELQRKYDALKEEMNKRRGQDEKNNIEEKVEQNVEQKVKEEVEEGVEEEEEGGCIEESRRGIIESRG